MGDHTPAVASPGKLARIGYSTYDRVKAGIPVKTRGNIQLRRVSARRPSAAMRMLPQLLVIGTQRGGTSSLYSYLGRHPDVVSSLRKETLFFSVLNERGIDWYRAHFPLSMRAASHRLSGRSLITFEATPDYLLDQRAAGRAADTVPDAKIIALLRNPVDRAYSQYQHNLRLGTEDLSFEDALEAEEERTAGEVEKLQNDAGYQAVSLRRFGYVARGRYAEQLRPWLELYPSSSLEIVRSEDFYADPASTLAALLSFIGLRAWQPAEFRNYSYADPSTRPSDGVLPATRAELWSRFQPLNTDLYDLIGRDMRWRADGPGATDR